MIGLEILGVAIIVFGFMTKGELPVHVGVGEMHSELADFGKHIVKKFFVPFLTLGLTVLLAVLGLDLIGRRKE